MNLIRAIIAAAFLGVAFSPVDAAVRQCREIVSSDIASAPSEREAKRQALTQWHVKAAKLGAGFDSWRLAADKALKCFPKAGGFECVAFGRPCLIQQSPKARPTIPAGKSGGI